MALRVLAALDYYTLLYCSQTHEEDTNRRVPFMACQTSVPCCCCWASTTDGWNLLWAAQFDSLTKSLFSQMATLTWLPGTLVGSSGRDESATTHVLLAFAGQKWNKDHFVDESQSHEQTLMIVESAWNTFFSREISAKGCSRLTTGSNLNLRARRTTSVFFFKHVLFFHWSTFFPTWSAPSRMWAPSPFTPFLYRWWVRTGV